MGITVGSREIPGKKGRDKTHPNNNNNNNNNNNTFTKCLCGVSRADIYWVLILMERDRKPHF
jgi:hypothetical protein